MKKRLLLIIVMFLLAVYLSCEKNVSGSRTIELIENGSFEKEFNHILTFWTFYTIYTLYDEGGIDTTLVYKGKYSAKIQREYATNAPAFYYQYINDVENIKKVKFSVFMTTRNIRNGCAYISVSAFDKNNRNLSGRSTRDTYPVKGNTIWQEFSVELELPNGTEKLQIFLNHMGDGTVWFDSASLTGEM